MVHRIFQTHHIPPDEFWEKPYNVRQFMLASELIVYEQQQEDEKKRAQSSQQPKRRKRKGGRR